MEGALDDALVAGGTDIVTFWVFPREDGAQLQRHVFALPLSRERSQLLQPRQDDLLQFLTTKLGETELVELLGRTRINLAPTAA